jgi:hypothetical protein
MQDQGAVISQAKKIQSIPRAAVLQIKKRVDNNNEELEIRLRLPPGLLQFKRYLV